MMPAKRPSKALARANALLPPALLGFLVFLFCFPLLFLLLGSFMSDRELDGHLAGMVTASDSFASLPPLPHYPTLLSYVQLLLDSPQFYPLFWNSVIIVLLVLVGQILFALPAAWAFARYSFKGRRALFFIYILLMLMPFQVMMLPEYLVLDTFHLIDSLAAIIIPGIFSVFPVFILYHFFRSIPQNVLDAARIDGAGELMVFLRVGLPLAKPGIFAVLLLGFLEYWNLIEQPLAFLSNKLLWPISLFLPSATLVQANLVFVTAIMATIPSVFAFLLGRQYFEQGFVTLAGKK